MPWRTRYLNANNFIRAAVGDRMPIVPEKVPQGKQYQETNCLSGLRE
jgi:hypothetical protein